MFVMIPCHSRCPLQIKGYELVPDHDRIYGATQRRLRLGQVERTSMTLSRLPPE